MTISLKCLPCGCELQGDTEKKYKSEDFIKCQECKKLNKYGLLIDVAKSEAREMVIKKLNDRIEKTRKNLFKKTKTIK